MQLDTELENYINAHSEPEPPVLTELVRKTHLSVMRPRMLSGNLQGQFLKMLCEMLQARCVLEIGTYTGYAAIRMAMGLKPGAVLHTIDINDELEEMVRDFIRRSGMEDRICFHIGDACEVIPELEEEFDLVFIDGDKRQYAEYYRLVIDKVRPGGILVADDVLWDGKVVDGEEVKDPQTRGIIAFNEEICRDQRVEKVILPVRHGLTLIRKK